MKKITIVIKGTHCNACKMLIEDVCKNDIKGISSCNVDFKTGKTEIKYDENLDWKLFKKGIEDLGNYTIDVSSL